MPSQCINFGRFHLLSDFDEGKRSCRRKLERHNRRRRKTNDSKGDTEKETQQIILTDDVSGDDTTGKGITTFYILEDFARNIPYDQLPLGSL